MEKIGSRELRYVRAICPLSPPPINMNVESRAADGDAPQFSCDDATELPAKKWKAATHVSPTSSLEEGELDDIADSISKPTSQNLTQF